MSTLRKSASTVVIGAGPYGLSAAAHLAGAGVPTQVFGTTMEFWQRMPAGLCLKSPWSASSLSDPGGTSNLDAYARARSVGAQEPIPLDFFLDYGRWFQQRCVPNLDSAHVASLTRDGERFRIELSDGRTLTAGRVVVAVGISEFAHVPEFVGALPRSLVSHTQWHDDLTGFDGKRVAVIGTGQSALESAALLRESGAEVELLVRGRVAWVNRALYDLPGPVKRIFYPPTDVGPPGINWLVAFPLLMRRVPVRARAAMHRRSIRPAGAKWLRPRVDGQVKITEGAVVRRLAATAGRLRIELEDGSTREVDHLFLGTGYRPALRKIPFLDETMRRQIDERNGFPVLNQWFESSVPGLHLIGGVAGYSFGPLCNFVAGAAAASRQVARRAAAAS